MEKAIVKFDKMQPLFSQRNHILILDWSNVVARAFSVAGESETHFFTRLLSMVHNYRESFNNYEFVFALEGKGKQERRKLFPQYKFGARKSLNIPQKYYHKSLELLNFFAGKQIKAPLGEADDAIAAFLRQKVSLTDQIGIITEDKDLWQLIQDPFRWVESSKRGRITESEVNQILKGLKPSDILLHKVLYGDISDNIPKVPQLRSQTITKIVRKVYTFKNLQTFLKKLQNKNLSWITKKEKENLLLCKEQIKLNYKLVKLRDDLNILVKNKKSKPNKLKKFLITSNVFSFSTEELNVITGK